MKNRVLSIVSILLLSLTLTSCNVSKQETLVPKDTLPFVVKFDLKKIYRNTPEGSTLNIVADTMLPYRITKLHTPPAVDVDLSAIKNTTDPDLKDKPLRLVAIGGSLTAGVRDGGYFNDGMLTSYPNLIARQMKLKEFCQPLFSKEEYNGFGMKLPTTFNPTGGPIIKFAAVRNNVGVISENNGEVILTKFDGEVDNWAIPNITTYGLARNAQDMSIQEIRKFAPYLARITDGNNKSIRDKIKNSKFDFFIFQIGMDDIINSTLLGQSVAAPYYAGLDYRVEMLALNQINIETKAKGCIANLPDFLDFPYIKSLTFSSVFKQTGYNLIIAGTSSLRNPEDLLLPTSAVDTLLSKKLSKAVKKGLTYENPLSYKDILIGGKQNALKSYVEILNGNYAYIAKEKKWALVDLNTLYKQIIAGQYTTEDGILVNPSYPNGNFFSSDGINPTPFGQAIIANEFIRTINTYYKTNIPLINVREYLK